MFSAVGTNTVTCTSLFLLSTAQSLRSTSSNRSEQRQQDQDKVSHHPHEDMKPQGPCGQATAAPALTPAETCSRPTDRRPLQCDRCHSVLLQQVTSWEWLRASWVVLWRPHVADLTAPGFASGSLHLSPNSEAQCRIVLIAECVIGNSSLSQSAFPHRAGLCMENRGSASLCFGVQGPQQTHRVCTQ